MKRLALAALLATTGCSLGQGTGTVHSDNLIAPGCWGVEGADGAVTNGEYDLLPDFFAAVPDQDQEGKRTLQIRVQRGTDLQEVSDGLVVLIDDVGKVRAALSPNGTDPRPFSVTLPLGVQPAGSPSVPPPDQLNDSLQGCTVDDPCPPIVHMALYLQRSCHNQNIVLYAVSGTIEILSMFTADPNEAAAADKLIDVKSFDVQMGDPRKANAGDYPSNIPAESQSRVTGSFTFYFERGQPGQPFP